MSGSVGRQVGRYVLFDEIASGGTATVHLGRLLGSEGFSRTVAIKRLHPTFAKDPEVVALFVEEARLASRIRHPNVLTTLDVVSESGELMLVLEYVPGLPLSGLMRALGGGGQMPITIATSIVTAALNGLQAAHEATNDLGEPMQLVHRDVSPQNLLVGRDGVVRVADFGIAKALGRAHATQEGQVKGKAPYMAPEQIRGRAVDRRTDVYAASVVLYEALTGTRLFKAESPLAVMTQVLEKPVPSPRVLRPEMSVELEAIVQRGMARNPDDRFASALEMAVALEQVMGIESNRTVGAWVEEIAGQALESHAALVRELESVPRLATVAEPKPSAPGPRRVLAVAVSVAVLAAVLALTIRASRTAQVESLVLQGPPPAPVVADQPTLSATEPPTPSAIIRPTPTTSAQPVAPLAPKVRPAGPKGEGKARCTPPYTVEPDGTRHWKAGC